jgi:uncharacterized protein (TIGR02145 family)
MKLFSLYLACFFGTSSYFAQNELNKKDFTGSQSEEVIGDQIWMKCNLSTKKFRNGDSIFQAQSDIEWINAFENRQPAWCYALDRSDDTTEYVLYNYFALSDNRVISPDGWRVPNTNDWTNLINKLGGSQKAFTQFQEKDNIFNSPGFGYRMMLNWSYTDEKGNIIKGFSGTAFMGFYTWWVSKGNYLMHQEAGELVISKEEDIEGGYAIRCIKE